MNEFNWWDNNNITFLKKFLGPVSKFKPLRQVRLVMQSNDCITCLVFVGSVDAELLLRNKTLMIKISRDWCSQWRTHSPRFEVRIRDVVVAEVKFNNAVSVRVFHIRR